MALASACASGLKRTPWKTSNLRIFGARCSADLGWSQWRRTQVHCTNCFSHGWLPMFFHWDHSNLWWDPERLLIWRSWKVWTSEGSTEFKEDLKNIMNGVAKGGGDLTTSPQAHSLSTHFVTLLIPINPPKQTKQTTNFHWISKKPSSWPTRKRRHP